MNYTELGRNHGLVGTTASQTVREFLQIHQLDEFENNLVNDHKVRRGKLKNTGI